MKGLNEGKASPSVRSPGGVIRTHLPAPDMRHAVFQGMGYLHAKGIVHKELKSKNVFYDNGKVVITDFGLFGMSGVVREGR